MLLESNFKSACERMWYYQVTSDFRNEKIYTAQSEHICYKTHVMYVTLVFILYFLIGQTDYCLVIMQGCHSLIRRKMRAQKQFFLHGWLSYYKFLEID
jgi:hypothetical protein